jgi:hypothetical protein
LLLAGGAALQTPAAAEADQKSLAVEAKQFAGIDIHSVKPKISITDYKT